MKALVVALCGALVIGAASVLAPATHDNIVLDNTFWAGTIYGRAKISTKPGVDVKTTDWMNSMDISSGSISFSSSNWGSWSASTSPREGKIRFHDFWLNNGEGELQSWAANAIGNITGFYTSIDSAEGSGYVRGSWDLGNILMRSSTRVRGFGTVNGQPRTFRGKLSIDGMLFNND